MTVVKKYPCDLCGKRSTSEQMIFSTYTQKRYCRPDNGACERRAKKRKRQLVR